MVQGGQTSSRRVRPSQLFDLEESELPRTEMLWAVTSGCAVAMLWRGRILGCLCGPDSMSNFLMMTPHKPGRIIRVRHSRQDIGST